MTRKLSPEEIPSDFPVRPLRDDETPKGRTTCGTCGLSWDDDISTSRTPTPSGRCPFEYQHDYSEPERLAAKRVHVVIYEHRHGQDVTVHATPEGAERRKVGLAREYWDEVAGRDGCPETAPEDDAEAVGLYFDTHPSESISSTVVEIES